jgi:hypothetical protein
MSDIPKEGDVVLIAAFDDVPEHLFEVQEVFEDCITGIALTGPLKGLYGEPALDMIVEIKGAGVGSSQT